MEVDPSQPPTPAPTQKKRAVKREIMIDPETKEELPDPKRQNLNLDAELKVKVLKLLIDSYYALRTAFLDTPGCSNVNVHSLNFSHQLTSIIFTCHNIRRGEANNKEKPTNMNIKSAETDFSITQLGKTYSMKRDSAFTIWDGKVKDAGLEYKVDKDDKTNWIGTIGPYINMFGAWGYRLQELRVGQGKMPMGKTPDGTVKFVPVTRYGLTQAHHVLLEGITYLPERKTSMAMSVGPLTAMLTMLNGEGKYRHKWETAVKRQFMHCPAIDDFIVISKKDSDSPEVRTAMGLYADLLLLITSRQTQRANLPLGIFAHVYSYLETIEKKTPAQLTEYLKFFSCSGDGLFYTYQKMIEISKQPQASQWVLECSMSREMASQVAFHAIFGTYKEDFGILSAITSRATWNTREEMGTGFRKEAASLVRIEWPVFSMYSKLCSANQTGRQTGVYTQYTSVPCFSGQRCDTMSQEFYDYMKRSQTGPQSTKDIRQIIHLINSAIEDELESITRDKMLMRQGTKQWQDASKLDFCVKGTELPDRVLKTTGVYYMGKV